MSYLQCEAEFLPGVRIKDQHKFCKCSSYKLVLLVVFQDRFCNVSDTSFHVICIWHNDIA
jgi:hypothetical protein